MIKLQDFSLSFIKKETPVQCFPVNFAKFFRKSFLQNTHGQLLLEEHRVLLKMVPVAIANNILRLIIEMVLCFVF